MEIGIALRPAPPEADLAQFARAEADGFDRVTVGDSQNAMPDPFARIAAAAHATTTLRFTTCGVPPFTRLPAVVAGAAMTANQHAGGRMMVGIGRGDSALSLAGLPHPAPMADFLAFTTRLHDYLAGRTPEGLPRGIIWRPKDLATVPIDVSATGPNVIAAMARIVDRITFAVGTDHERIAWAVGVARKAAADAGRDPEALELGAWAPVAITDDGERAAELMRAPVANQAHFSAMRDTNVALHPPALARVSRPLKQAYLTRDRAPVECVDPEFVRWFAAIGDEQAVLDRLAPLAGLGLGHLYLLHANPADAAFTAESRERLLATVLPQLRAA